MPILIKEQSVTKVGEVVSTAPTLNTDYVSTYATDTVSSQNVFTSLTLIVLTGYNSHIVYKENSTKADITYIKPNEDGTETNYSATYVWKDSYLDANNVTHYLTSGQGTPNAVYKTITEFVFDSIAWFDSIALEDKKYQIYSGQYSAQAVYDIYYKEWILNKATWISDLDNDYSLYNVETTRNMSTASYRKQDGYITSSSEVLQPISIAVAFDNILDSQAFYTKNDTNTGNETPSVFAESTAKYGTFTFTVTVPLRASIFIDNVLNVITAQRQNDSSLPYINTNFRFNIEFISGLKMINDNFKIANFRYNKTLGTADVATISFTN